MSRFLLCLLTLQIAASVVLADDSATSGRVRSSRRYKVKVANYKTKVADYTTKVADYQTRVADYQTRVADYTVQETEELSNAPTVFNSEHEYRSNLGVYQSPAFSGMYGYVPGCCQNPNYAADLWSGYCESRKQTWYSKWLFGFGGVNCDCGECK